MHCGSCGASQTPDMVDAGACGFCGTVLPKAPEPVQHVHVTKLEVRAPAVDVNVGGCFDSVTARVAGCFSGCGSMLITLLILSFSFGITAWQVWSAGAIDVPQIEKPKPHPSPSPVPDKKRRGRRGH